LTADVTTVDVEKLQQGMNDYISKPLDEKVLHIALFICNVPPMHTPSSCN
jgi:CheY-like chemotaxis protein